MQKHQVWWSKSTVLNGAPMMRPNDINPLDIVNDGLQPDSGIMQLPLFARGADWDFQRVGSDTIPTTAFIDFANVSIGLYSAAANIPESVVFDIANRYAASSDFGDAIMDATYTHLRAANVYDIKLGYSLYTLVKFNRLSSP